MVEKAIMVNVERGKSSLTLDSFRNAWTQHARLTENLPPSSKHLRPLCANLNLGESLYRTFASRLEAC
jgi:hypothetical protein